MRALIKGDPDMNQSKQNRKTKILRFFWGFFPWLVVILILGFVLRMAILIKDKNERLEEARKAEIREDTLSVRVITLTVEPKKIEDKINLPATVEPQEDLWVKAEVPGP